MPSVSTSSSSNNFPMQSHYFFNPSQYLMVPQQAVQMQQINQINSRDGNNKNVSEKPKRFCTSYTSQQRYELEKVFLEDLSAIIFKLSVKLKLQEKQVKVWFQNRRMKERKKKATKKSAAAAANLAEIGCPTMMHHSYNTTQIMSPTIMSSYMPPA
ncbi:PREDICTED: paired mesoderm homeobox protein 2A-like [Nicrophorus vespilloides]|uniref:Paired mesoderm homeobox protein 2A-like n=1 Tax=Nicrophorus vespilloides TaxID=110193 RepID=A0ABM1M3N5_NICVS|nr:PREDICTED: paired mesoderm homeobox protein 2A-like [Nicrophorus vespilloides]